MSTLKISCVAVDDEPMALNLVESYIEKTPFLELKTKCSSAIEAMQFIKDLTAKAELNKIYNGKVMKIMEFGAFVNFLGKQDGLVHISELADKRVAKVTDVVKEGDEVKQAQQVH